MSTITLPVIYDASLLIAFLAGCLVGSVVGGAGFFFGALNWYCKHGRRIVKSVARH